MRRQLFLSILTFAISGGVFCQTSIQDGDWQTGSNWSGGSSPGVTNLGSANITVANDLQVGAYGNDVGLIFSANNDSRAITINAGQTLIVYGDVDFANKAMDLVIEGTLIIVGNLDMNNRIDISSNGTLVVTGTFNKNGSQGSYTGTGKVYAGGYSGDADALIPGNNTDGDQQQLLSDLETDGLTDVAAFVDGGGATPLPVTLGAFDFRTNAHTVTLNWTTLSEENFEFFEIQRADENAEFSTIGTVQGNGTSKGPVNYTWTDENPVEGSNYYRLISNDFDGFRETFKAIYVNFESYDSHWTLYPNPSPANGKLSLTGKFGGDVWVRVYSLQGGLIKEYLLEERSIQLQNELHPGVYIIEIVSNGLNKKLRLVVR